MKFCTKFHAFYFRKRTNASAEQIKYRRISEAGRPFEPQSGEILVEQSHLFYRNMSPKQQMRLSSDLPRIEPHGVPRTAVIRFVDNSFAIPAVLHTYRKTHPVLQG